MRSFLYALARLLGDVQAVKRGRIFPRLREPSYRPQGGVSPVAMKVDRAHGEVRHIGVETRHTARGNAAITETVDERWCGACSEWIEVRGPMGRFRFEFDHEHGKSA